VTTSRNPTVFGKAKALYQSYPRPFWVLMAGTFIDRFGTNLIMPFLAIYVARRFDVQLAQVGIIFTIFAVSGAAGNMLSGALADRFGRRFTLLLGLVCAAAARVWLGMADDMTMLYIAAGFAGLFGAVGWPAQIAMTVDLLGHERRADGFGIQRVIINSTFALGPMAGALLAPITGYLALFILDAITSYIVAFLVFRDLPETRPEQGKDKPAEDFGQTMAGYARVTRDGTFMAFVLIATLSVIAHMQMNTSLALFLVKFQRLPESFYGALVTLNAAMVVFIQFPLTRRVSRRPPLLIMVGGALLYLVGFGMYGVTTATPLFVVAMVLVTGGEMLFIPTSQALIALFAPQDMRARYVATERFSWIIAQALGPLAAGVIMDRFDPRWVWYGCAIVCAISAAGFYALHVQTGTRLAQKQSDALRPPAVAVQAASAD
jgi:MFS family permease